MGCWTCGGEDKGLRRQSPRPSRCLNKIIFDRDWEIRIWFDARYASLTDKERLRGWKASRCVDHKNPPYTN